jgi:hypothetical protein
MGRAGEVGPKDLELTIQKKNTRSLPPAHTHSAHWRQIGCKWGLRRSLHLPPDQCDQCDQCLSVVRFLFFKFRRFLASPGSPAIPVLACWGGISSSDQRSSAQICGRVVSSPCLRVYVVNLPLDQCDQCLSVVRCGFPRLLLFSASQRLRGEVSPLQSPNPPTDPRWSAVSFG